MRDMLAESQPSTNSTVVPQVQVPSTPQIVPPVVEKPVIQEFVPPALNKFCQKKLKGKAKSSCIDSKQN